LNDARRQQKFVGDYQITAAPMCTSLRFEGKLAGVRNAMSEMPIELFFPIIDECRSIRKWTGPPLISVSRARADCDLQGLKIGEMLVDFDLASRHLLDVAGGRDNRTVWNSILS
jgi:hypothetical protein